MPGTCGEKGKEKKKSKDKSPGQLIVPVLFGNSYVVHLSALITVFGYSYLQVLSPSLWMPSLSPRYSPILSNPCYFSTLMIKEHFLPEPSCNSSKPPSRQFHESFWSHPLGARSDVSNLGAKSCAWLSTRLGSRHIAGVPSRSSKEVSPLCSLEEVKK